MKVFISSSSRVEDQEYVTLAKKVTNIFTKKNYDLICGGITSGIMKHIFLEFQKNKRNTTCITLEVYQEDLSLVEKSYLVDNTFDRTKKIYEMMDVGVFLPGGTGSFNELLAMLEETRTINQKPLILYNENNYFNKFLEFLNILIEKGFNDKNILNKIIVVNSIKELEEIIDEKEKNYE